MLPKILFVLKQSQTSAGHSYSNEGGGSSKSGLYNSAKFVVNALKEFLGIESKIVIVGDGNAIDKEVHNFQPNLVILEALWCPSYKVKELIKLYPKVQWVIRIHSKTPFLANEGIALTWISELSIIAKTNKNLFIAFKAKDTYKEFKEIGINGSVYLPNFYYPDKNEHYDELDLPCFHEKNAVNIGCFSAVRPFKNQLTQAIAAIDYANKHTKKLYFHLNAGRIEQKGEQVLKNIEALFKNSQHILVKWGWLDHGTFVHLLSKMDVSLQVSLSESFYIVASDSVYAKVPVVVSDEIDWLPFFCRAETGSALSIAHKIAFVLKFKFLAVTTSEICLDIYNNKSFHEWKKFFEMCKFF
jgi:hypothetical protein